MPGQVVNATAVTLKTGETQLVDHAFREDLEQRATAARLGRATLSPEDSKLIEAETLRPFLEQAVIEQLEKLDEAHRLDVPGIVGRSIRFFYLGRTSARCGCPRSILAFGHSEWSAAG